MMQGAFLAAAFAVGLGVGAQAASMHYKQLIAEADAARAAIVQQEQERNAQQLSEAANSIIAASREYDIVRSERDRLIVKLRQYASASGGATASAPGRTCEERATRLARMVEELSGLVEKCDSGWHGCAARKDALIEAVK